MKRLFYTVCCFAAAITGKADINTNFLRRVMVVESEGRANVKGDGGRALGYYQFHASTWEHVSAMRKVRLLPIYTYKDGAVNLQQSTSYAGIYFEWIRDQLEAHKIVPTQDRMYAAFNAGVNNVIRVKGDISKLSDRARRNVARFRSIQR